MAIMGARQLVNLPLQPCYGIDRVAVQTRLTVAITGQFGNPRAQSINRCTCTGFLICQLIFLHQQSLNDRSRNRVFFAHGRQRIFGCFTLFCGKTRCHFCIGGVTYTVAQDRIGIKTRKISLAPAAIQQRSFGAAQLFANFTIPHRLF